MAKKPKYKDASFIRVVIAELKLLSNFGTDERLLLVLDNLNGRVEELEKSRER